VSALFTRVLAAKRKRLLGDSPVFEPYEAAFAPNLAELESRIACRLPASLRAWLLQAGYGDLNEELSLRAEWFSVLDRGPLKGHILFAQDILGNFYSFSPANGEIHYVCRSAPEYAFMAPDFGVFLEELESRSFDLKKWIGSLEVSPYAWDA